MARPADPRQSGPRLPTRVCPDCGTADWCSYEDKGVLRGYMCAACGFPLKPDGETPLRRPLVSPMRYRNPDPRTPDGLPLLAPEERRLWESVLVASLTMTKATCCERVSDAMDDADRAVTGYRTRIGAGMSRTELAETLSSTTPYRKEG